MSRLSLSKSPLATKTSAALMVWLLSILLPTESLVPNIVRSASAQGYPDDQEFPEMMLPGQDGDATGTGRRARSKATTKRGRAVDKSAAKKTATKGANGTTKASDAGPGAFAGTIAPIFVANCTTCHSGQGQGVRRGKFELTTFDKLSKGTADHKVIVPGKPDESSLVLHIRGDETPQMPPGQDKLSKEAIAKIEQWVKAGAKLDPGLDPKAIFQSYAATPEQLRKADLAKLPADKRDAKTESAGRERWKQAGAKLTEVIPGEHFIMFTSLPRERATSTLKSMEPQFAHLRRFLGDTAMNWPEKLSLYVFSTNKEFTEFVRTVEGRDADLDSLTSAKLAIAQPYIAVVDPAGGKKEEVAAPKRKSRPKRGEDAASSANDRSLQGVLAEALGTSCMGLVGAAPRWLREGVGTYLAAQITVEKHSTYYQRLRRFALEKVDQGWETKASDALGDGIQLAPDEFHAISFAIVEALNSPDYREHLPAFVHAMFEGGGKLDDALKAVYNGTRENFLELTKTYVFSHYGNNE
jgi:mono/diheme cytochrome c family protein